MRIADSNVVMASKRSYEEGYFSGTIPGGRIYGRRAESFEGVPVSDREREEKNFGRLMVKNRELRTERDVLSDMRKVRFSLLSLIMERLGKKKALPFMSTMNPEGSFLPFSGYNSGVHGSTFINAYGEYESVDFFSRGQVNTEDGRTIDFGVTLSMTRSYLEYVQADIPSIGAAFIDPLVINTNAPAAMLKDQKFKFDLDCDGIEEEISELSAGSGFLALDRDSDGRINDGSELFGARTGDGFSELAKFDNDGNGWIDENDPVFSRLKVWYRDLSGKDVLMDLKAADVGAIFLGSTETEFGLKSASGADSGRIRSTGVFLKESGGVGTLQHVDLAAV